MTILYEVNNKAYLNITNKCPCACVFCIRNNGDGAYGSDSLWLEHEPDFEEIKAAIDEADIQKYSEIVFCGYGEPTEKLDLLLKTADYIKSLCDIPIRINTNGLSDLINNKPTAQLLKNRADIVSISLNASNPEEYAKVSNSCFGGKSFDALLKFAEGCKKTVPKVIFTVVDVISEEEIERCKELSNRMGIELRVRKYDS